MDIQKTTWIDWLDDLNGLNSLSIDWRWTDGQSKYVLRTQ